MALKFTDKLKNIDLSEVSKVASNVTNSLTAVKNLKPSKVEKTESSTDVIDSLDGLSGYLRTLQPDASPAVMMALQSQLQVYSVANDDIDGSRQCYGNAPQGAEIGRVRRAKRGFKREFRLSVTEFNICYRGAIAIRS